MFLNRQQQMLGMNFIMYFIYFYLGVEVSFGLPEKNTGILVRYYQKGNKE